MNIIRKCIILFSIVLTPISSYPQFGKIPIHYSCYYDGYWGDWDYDGGYKIWGGYGGFCIYRTGQHRSNYFFKFKINNYSTPTKKEIKHHLKNKEWWVYNGTVEYYVCDVYPTLKDYFKKDQKLLEEWVVTMTDYKEKLSAIKATKMMKGESFSPMGYKKKISNATIKIEPYKKRPKVYNIYMDGVGYAIDMKNQFFPD